MSTLIAPLLEKLITLTEARLLRWEATASENTYIASQTVRGGAIIFEMSLELMTDSNDEPYWGEALYVKRSGTEGTDRKVPVVPDDGLDGTLMRKLWKLASSAETTEFLESVLKDLGVDADPSPPLADDFGPVGESEDPFGDQ